MKLLGAVLLLSLPLSAQVEVYSDLGEAGDQVVRRLLEARLAEVPVVLPWSESALSPGTGALLVGVDAHVLHSLAEQGVLVPTALADLPSPFRGPQGRYAITLLSLYAVAFNAQLVDWVDVPQSWDDLLDLKYQDRLIIGTPEAMPDLWDTWRERELRRGDGERRAVAWLTTLDARVGSYVDSGAVVGRSLIDGSASLGVVQRRHLGERQLEQGSLEQVLLPGEVAAAGLGVGWSAGAEDGETAAVHAVLVSAGFNLELAAETGLVAVPRPGEDPASRTRTDLDVLGRLHPLQLDPEARQQWVQHWRENVRGRGRNLEGLSEFLDLILGVAFLGFLIFVYTRIRKSEPRSGRATRTD